MSIRLMVEMLDHAPAELTPSERLLLVAIAEKANEQTRMSWPGMDTLTQRTGLSDRRVRQVLADLAARGYEVRVASGVDRHGMPVFASKGHRTEYRVPAFAQRGTDTAALKGDAHGRLSGAKGGRSGTQRRPDPVAKGAGSGRPSPQEPSREPSNQRARADEVAAVIGALRDRTGKTVNETHAGMVVDQLLDGRRNGGIHTTTVRYLTGAIARDSDPSRFLPVPDLQPVLELLATMNPLNPPKGTAKQCDPNNATTK
jgi:hypothetical protein